MLVWLNGRLGAARDARVSALDRGLLHGDGAYDTWRTYGGVPFAVAAHLRRLGTAARVLRLPSPGPAALWERRTRLLVARAGLGDAAIRLTVTRGDAGDALLPSRRARPTVLLTARPLPDDLAHRRRDGVAVVLLPFARDAGPYWGGLKLVGHVSAVVGRMTAARRRAAEAIYVTPDGYVTEATTANVFVVDGRRLLTPPVSAGILPGVTRAIVLTLARRVGLVVHETPVRVDALRRAREIFLTASTIEVVPVVRLDDHRIGSGQPGRVTRLLQERYAAHVARAVVGLRRT